MKTQYKILINPSGIPVLVEVPEKPVNDLCKTSMMTENHLHQLEVQSALSDTSKHIKFKDENMVKNEIISELNLQIALKGEASDNYILSDKLPVGQTFDLHENVSVEIIETLPPLAILHREQPKEEVTETEIYEALKDDKITTDAEVDENLKEEYKRAWLKGGWFKLYLHRMEKLGITEFRFVNKGKRQFMIHPLGKDGETLDFDL